MVRMPGLRLLSICKSELEKILDGEPPYDIFVRWKPLHEQPIGWEPDLNDGVRLNIRPWLTATLRHTRKPKKGACILRVTPKIRLRQRPRQGAAA